MRIAYFTNQYPATSHTFIRREIVALEARGHMVRRYAIRRAPENLEDPADIDELEKTEHVLDLEPKALLFAIRTAFLGPLSALRAFRTALRFAAVSHRSRPLHLAYLLEALVIAYWCRRDGIEHLHVHFGTNPATVGALVAELTGIPFSFTVHGPEEFDRAREYGLDRKVAMASFVAAVSSFGRSQLMRWASVEDWGKIHVVHCGLDQPYLEDRSAEMADNPRLLCVARLAEQKGLLVLLHAAAMLRDQGVAFTLVLVGDGPLRGALEKAVHDLDLGGHVRLLGWMGQPQVRQQIRMSRAMVLPSFAEGLPVVLMESMALRRPIISTYIAGIPELADPDTGWLIPAGDTAALCAAMRAAVESSAPTLRRMGELARRRVLSRHDAATSAALLERHMARHVAANSRTGLALRTKKAEGAKAVANEIA